jgi:hypothetical protein
MRISFFLLLLLMSLTSFAQTSVAQWFNGNAVADGKINEWKLPLRFYDDKTHLNYNVVNNDSFLFVVVRVSEETYQMKVVHAGLKFAIDTPGKKKGGPLIAFPIGISGTIQKKQQNQQSQQPYGVNGMRARMKSGFLEMQLTGFKASNGVDSTTAANGVSAGADWDSSGVLNIEFKIPFTSFYHVLSAKDDAGKTFSLTITENSSPAPDIHGGHNESGDDSYGNNGMGGGGMGGAGGGHHSMNGGMNGDSSGSYSNWRDNADFFGSLSASFKIQMATTPN